MNEYKDNNSISREKRRLSSGIITAAAVFAAFAVCVVIFHFVYEKAVTQVPVFFDLIIEETAESGFNKAGEIKLFNALTVTGILIIAAFVFSFRRSLAGKAKVSSTGLIPLLFVVPALIYLAVSGVFSLPLFF